MKKFLEFLTNVRFAATEIGGTVSVIFLMVFGAYKAWQEFIAPALWK
jgi:hypothetical protein